MSLAAGSMFRKHVPIVAGKAGRIHFRIALAPRQQDIHPMKFAHFSHVWGKPGMTAHQRYEQLWRELALCDDLGFDYSFCVEHHFRPD